MTNTLENCMRQSIDACEYRPCPPDTVVQIIWDAPQQIWKAIQCWHDGTQHTYRVIDTDASRREITNRHYPQTKEIK